MSDTFPSQGPNHNPQPQPPWLSSPPGAWLTVPTLLCRPQAPSLDPRMGDGAETDPRWAAASAPGASGSRAGRWVCEGRKGAGLAVLALAWVPSSLSVTQATRRVPSPPGFGSLSLAGEWALNRWAHTGQCLFWGRTLELGRGDGGCAPPRPSQQAAVRRVGGDGGKGPSQCKGPGVRRRLEDLRAKKGRSQWGWAEPWRPCREEGFVQKEREGGEGSCISSC